MKTSRSIVCVTLSLMLLQGCSSPGNPLSLQTKLLGCAGFIAGAALISSQRGARGGARGAVSGAAVGAVGCGIWLLLNLDEDKKVSALQTESLRTQQPQRATWPGPDGSAQQRTAVVTSTTPQDTTLVLKHGDRVQQVCSTVTTQISVGRETSSEDALWCKGQDGEFAPARGVALASQ